jgi:Ankyrin repeats (3 copies)
MYDWMKEASSRKLQQEESEGKCSGCLNWGIKFDSRDRDNRTPLSLTAEHGELLIVTLLLENGADINSTDVNGRTALSHGAEGGHPNIVKLLLQKGADREIKDCERTKARIWCYETGVRDVDGVLKLLVPNPLKRGWFRSTRVAAKIIREAHCRFSIIRHHRRHAGERRQWIE